MTSHVHAFLRRCMGLLLLTASMKTSPHTPSFAEDWRSDCYFRPFPLRGSSHNNWTLRGSSHNNWSLLFFFFLLLLLFLIAFLTFLFSSSANRNKNCVRTKIPANLTNTNKFVTSELLSKIKF